MQQLALDFSTPPSGEIPVIASGEKGKAHDILADIRTLSRQDARRELNWAYDRFDSVYGSINKTSFGETKDGGVIRRMPNLVKFREDPDAMLVMSLEDYVEGSGGEIRRSRGHHVNLPGR